MSNRQEQPESNLPTGLARPAQRALAAAGYRRLEQLAKVSEAQLAQLHGIGPKAIGLLRRALTAEGLSFAAESEAKDQASSSGS